MKTQVIVVTAVLAVVGAGGSPHQQTSAPPQSGQQSPPYHGSLDQLLGPIALYPDPLLAQILISAGDPAQVIKLDQWLKNTTTLNGTKLQDAAVKAGFDPSFVVLVLFPQVVSNMAKDIQWTTRLGQAFTAERSAVFDAIQRLRHQAENVGTLKDTPQQEVSSRKTSRGEDVIVIEPANPQVVYVPQYNYTTVYTQAPAVAAPAPTTSTVIVQEDNSSEAAIAAGLIGFTAGIVIGAAMDNHYYYGPYGWHGGAYMYNDGWDDYWDHREDAREDWMDHREDIMEERGDYAENRAENRSDVAENRSQNRSDVAQNRADTRTQRAETRGDRAGTAQQQQTERQQSRPESRPQTQAQRHRNSSITTAQYH